jgi:DNA primase
MNFQKPDIVTVIQNEGVHLIPKGKSLSALCPFHTEKHPSFRVYTEQNSFYCFGCGTGGDSISFIKKYKNLTFQEAVKYLGINGKPYRPNPKEIRRKELLRQFRQWCNEYYDDLCLLYRTLQRAKEKAKTIEEVEALAPFYHQESTWLYQIEILQGDGDQAKFKLYKEVVFGN